MSINIVVFLCIYFAFSVCILVHCFVWILWNASIMVQSKLLEWIPTSTSLLAWAGNRPAKKEPEYYSGLKEQYEKFVFGNELLPMTLLLNVVSTKTISLLTTDVKSHKFIGVNRENMEETLKSLNIRAKVLAW